MGLFLEYICTVILKLFHVHYRVKQMNTYINIIKE